MRMEERTGPRACKGSASRLVASPGGEALPLAPAPLTARTLRALDPMSWHAR